MKQWMMLLILTTIGTSLAQTPERVDLVYGGGRTQSYFPATAPSPAPAPAAFRPFVGINLEGMSDYNSSMAFCDLMKNARKFGSPSAPWDESTPAPVDADGNPTADFGAIWGNILVPGGDYLFRCDGKGIVSAGPSAQVVSQNFDAATKQTSAIVRVTETPNRVNFVLSVTGTSGGVKHVQLLRPGSKDSDTFNPVFLNSLAPFRAVRFMDWLATNGNPSTTWESRSKVTDARWSGAGGVPYEICIDLCNATGKDAWINIPVGATDDHIQKLGSLVRSRLKPGLACYVEFSNEVWNGSFPQYQANFDAARAEVAAGDPGKLNFDGSNNPWYHAWRRVAERDVQIKKILGGEPFRVVLASQVGYAPPGALVALQLDYVAKTQGKVSDFLYAIASAPYFSPGMAADGKNYFVNVPGLTVNSLIARLGADAVSTKSDYVKAFHQLAQKYGIRSFAYEGGEDVRPGAGTIADVNLPMVIATQTDPRVSDVIGSYIWNFFDGYPNGGGDGFMYFSHTGVPGKFGAWELLTDPRRLDAPKYQGAAAAAKKVAELPLR